jgi:hypothetical protein
MQNLRICRARSAKRLEILPTLRGSGAKPQNLIQPSKDITKAKTRRNRVKIHVVGFAMPFSASIGQRTFWPCCAVRPAIILCDYSTAPQYQSTGGADFQCFGQQAPLNLQ